MLNYINNGQEWSHSPNATPVETDIHGTRFLFQDVPRVGNHQILHRDASCEPSRKIGSRLALLYSVLECFARISVKQQLSNQHAFRAAKPAKHRPICRAQTRGVSHSKCTTFRCESSGRISGSPDNILHQVHSDAHELVHILTPNSLQIPQGPPPGCLASATRSARSSKETRSCRTKRHDLQIPCIGNVRNKQPIGVFGSASLCLVVRMQLGVVFPIHPLDSGLHSPRQPMQVWQPQATDANPPTSETFCSPATSITLCGLIRGGGENISWQKAKVLTFLGNMLSLVQLPSDWWSGCS